MIKLTLDPQVTTALQAAFPNSNAHRALSKYLTLLETHLNSAIAMGRSPEELKLNLYSIPVSKMLNRGGQIGPNKVWVHCWLDDNNYALLTNIVTGSNLTGRYSQVKLTRWVTVEHVSICQTSTASAAPVHASLTLEAIYPDLRGLDDEQQLLEMFDVVPIDLDSLRAYLDWLECGCTVLSRDIREQRLHQAEFILNVAQQTSGKYLQRKKPSSFGRTYYQGISVQSVDKTLRRAMLGDCYEYDLSSASLTWKYGFAEQYLRKQGIQSEADRYFKTIYGYLIDKADFYNYVRPRVFGAASTLDEKAQNAIMKEAVTALLFGARATKAGWKCEDGSWSNPALVTILKDADARHRFLNCGLMRSFIGELRQLDGHIFREAQNSKRSDLLKNPDLRTESGRLNKSKVLAYLYQHAESEVMAIAYAVAKRYQRKPIARIHDAMIFKKRLSEDALIDIQYEIFRHTGNQHWRFKIEHLEGFKPLPSNASLQEEEAHRQRIAAEEALARAWIERH